MPMKGAETAGRKTPQRARLSDISNITTARFPRHGDENQLSIKASESHLHKDLAILKKVLAEKEEIIEAQKVSMENLWSNYTSKTKQNEDIIQQNARLLKDLVQARDKLKILQHENTQMAAAHKVSKSELRAKLTKALEQAENSLNSRPLSIEKIPCDKQATFPNMLTKLAESRARRSVNAYEGPCTPLEHVQDEGLENLATGRSALRRRSSLSYKEPSLKAKLRQQENTTPSQIKPCVNRQESRIHQLHNVCEEDLSNACITIPCSSESKVMENILTSVDKSTLQATSNSSCAWSTDVLEDQTSLSSSKAEERLHVTSVTHFESGDQLSIVTREPPSFIEDLSSKRPLRQAVSCISSYKEAPLNLKMRRPF